MLDAFEPDGCARVRRNPWILALHLALMASFVVGHELTHVTGPEYRALLDALKLRVIEARDRAALAANRELVVLYWSIGREILARQSAVGWGGKVIGRLSRDLRHAHDSR